MSEESYTEEVEVTEEYALLLLNDPLYLKPHRQSLKCTTIQKNDSECYYSVKIKNSDNDEVVNIKSTIGYDLKRKCFSKITDQQYVDIYKTGKLNTEINAFSFANDCRVFLANDTIFIFSNIYNSNEVTELLISLFESFAYVKFTNNAQIFNFSSEEAEDTILFKYLKLGGSLRNAVEVRNVKNLIASIYSSKNPFALTSSRIEFVEDFNFLYYDTCTTPIFICASSGTGKTQLPFALDIPLVYLIFNKRMVEKYKNELGFNFVAKNQTIYGYFMNLSSCFLDCLEKDYAFLMSIPENIQFKEDGSTELAMPKEYDSLLLVGFIINIYENIVKTRSSHKESWIISQLNIHEMKISGETFTAGRIKLQEIRVKMLKEERVLPTIFFDECIQLMNDKDNTRKYTFLRRLIKRLGLVGVFMGTHASISNFISTSENSDTRTEDKSPWAYIVYKLAPVLPSLIEMRKNEIINKQSDLPDNIVEEFKLFVNQISNFIKSERPLLCQYVFDFLPDEPYLLSFIQKNQNNFDIPLYFMNCLERVFNRFTERKKEFGTFSQKDCKSYSFANLQLMAPEYWRCKSNSIKDLEKNSGIHGHIAYLHVDHAVEKALGPDCNYFGIYCQNTNVFNYLGYFSLGKSIRFENEQIFKPFMQEPIGEMMYLVGNALNYTFIKFIKDSPALKLKRISTKEFIKSCKHKPLIGSSEAATANEWTLYESITGMSALLATFYNGFRGLAIRDWLRNFLYEMNIIENRNSEILYDENFEKFSNINIPCCSASLKAEWNQEFAEYFTSECGGRIGVLDASLEQASRDFTIREYNGKNSILSGECKNYAKGLSKADLFKIIKKLYAFDSPLNLIVCSKLTSKSIFKNFAESIRDSEIEEFSNRISIYYLEKSVIERRLVCVHGCNELETDSRVFLVIETD